MSKRTKPKTGYDELLPHYDFSAGVRGKHHNPMTTVEMPAISRHDMTLLYREVCELLWEEWDPIGVNGASTATDEYDSYAGTICRFLLDGCDESKLVAHLQDIQRNSMGLSSVDAECDLRVARLLLALVSPGDKNS